jgi:hypothetical protein
MTDVLDQYMPTWDIRERHATTIAAAAPIVWEVVRQLDLFALPFVRTIFRARDRVMRSKSPPHPPRPFLDEVQAIGWQRLEERPGECFVAGATCQPWRPNVVFQPIPPEQFRAFAEPDQVKIVWTIEVAGRDGSARLATETRAVATDEAARRRFRRYWRWARFGIIPIRWFMLRALRQQAEAAWRKRTTDPPRP